MVPSKSQVDFYVNLCTEVIACDPLQLSQPKGLKRDTHFVRNRTQSEGLSFLTKTLPKLGKALDHGLNGFAFECPDEFARSHRNSSVPAFMQDYFLAIFGDDGELLPAIAFPENAIRHLRQVCYLAYKLELPFSSEDERSVIDRFIETEEELAEVSEFNEEASQILEVASYLIEDIFTDFDPKDILPRHGPGAVSTGEKLDAKWEFSRKYPKIHSFYPYYDYFIVGGVREIIDRLEWYKNLTTTSNGVAKVVLVPKDSRGPRLISCEPLEFQWVQQGLGRKIMRHLERNFFTKGHVNFTNQSINQQLALESSRTKEYATIDMKDASDRVSMLLVQKVFKRTPELLRALEACRSDATQLPDGSIIYLKKFAPMGSALCFPLEAICFWAIIVATMIRYQRLNKGAGDGPVEIGQKVFIYGDDIVIPVEWASVCIPALEYFNLQVNVLKCCIKGKFRESCGVDAFNGHNVTPLRLHTLWSGRRADGSAYVSYIAFANEMASRGYPGVSDYLWRQMNNTYGSIPLGTIHSGYPCRIVDDAEIAERFNLSVFPHRTSRRYQRIEFFLPRTLQRKEQSRLDSWTRLLRNLTMPGNREPSTIVVPRSMSIKRGWTGV